MTPWQPDPALDGLIEALEAEILAAPDAEVRSLARDPMAQPNLGVLRALVVRAIEAGEEAAALPPATDRRSTLGPA